MLFESNYKTIENFAEFNFTEHSSRFMAFAFNVKSEKEMKNYLEFLKQKYPDATHHCYACVLYPDKSYIKINDDGEPSGTAGRPIINQINKAGLTNILIVVVRYFGGKKLGIPGLIAAYGNAANQCLKNAVVVDKRIMDFYKISVENDKNFEVYNIVKKYKANIIETSVGQMSDVLISIESEYSDKFLKECKLLANFEVKYLKTE